MEKLPLLQSTTMQFFYWEGQRAWNEYFVYLWVSLYFDYFIVGQVTPCQNQPEDLKNYECQSNEAKIYHPKYDTVSGEFLGLFQTLGYLTVWGDSGECFLGYGYSEGNSKILYSHYKMKILNSFLGSMFYRHRIQFESILNTDSSNIYFFLHSTTDRVEDINKYMGSVN